MINSFTIHPTNYATPMAFLCHTQRIQCDQSLFNFGPSPYDENSIPNTLVSAASTCMLSSLFENLRLTESLTFMY